jgi:hypothetical protein
MKAYFAAALVLLFITPAFAARNVISDCRKLDKKLRKDPNVVKVQENYIVRGNTGYDEFEVYVKNCYDKESLHRIPTWYKNTEVRVHCQVPAEK